MDATMQCVCGCAFSLSEAPEPMACSTVYEFTNAHAVCVTNAQAGIFIEFEEEEETEDEEAAEG